MKKIQLVALITILASSMATANYIKIQNAEDAWDEAESYKTSKPMQVEYLITYNNNYEPNPDLEEQPKPNKHGLYVNSLMKIKKFPSSTFPTTYPTVSSDLPKILKLNESDILKRFNGVSKKTSYECTVAGKMNAQFTVTYEGGDSIRFPSLVNADVKSATQIGTPVINCGKF